MNQMRDRKLKERLDACNECPSRSVNRCTIANRLCGMVAKDGECPLGRFPGQARRDTPKPTRQLTKQNRPKQLPQGLEIWRPHLLRVSVIVTCHNYARYLEDALTSIESQTRKPFEILVVDDASDDNPKEIVDKFPGVRFERVEFGNVHRSRAYGFENTSGEVVLFFDADNTIPSDFIASGLAQFETPRVGVVYPRILRFGRINGELRLEDGPHRMERMNFADTASLIRRDALAYTFALDEDIAPVDVADDWFLMKRIHRDRWEFRKNPAFLYYRTHDKNRSKLFPKIFSSPGYYKFAALERETITILIPLSGRLEIFRDDLAPFLDRQKWPKSQVSLLLIDTSVDDEFNEEVREWALRSDYEDVRVMRLKVASETGLADVDRRADGVERAVQDALSVIYNRAARAVDSPYLWIIEDDIIPPDNAAEEMLKQFSPDVASVSLPYESRFDPDVVAWYDDGTRAKPPQVPQVEEIHGSGFGCLMIRSALFKNHIFQVPPGELWYDPVFFKMLDRKWKRFLDWRNPADHLGAFHRIEGQGECLVR